MIGSLASRADRARGLRALRSAAGSEAMVKGYEYQTDFAKKYVAQGIAQGVAEGEAKGRAAEAARAVLTALRVRGIAVPDASRERILAEKDPARLERWHEKAILAASLVEVLGQPD